MTQVCTQQVSFEAIPVLPRHGFGLTGGITSVLQGGKFGHGFLSAGFAKAVTTYLPFDKLGLDGIGDKYDGWEYVAGRTTVAAISGGTASVIGGGKFENGAKTAALAHLLNAEQSNIKEKFAELVKNSRYISAVNDALFRTKADLKAVKQLLGYHPKTKGLKLLVSEDGSVTTSFPSSSNIAKGLEQGSANWLARKLGIGFGGELVKIFEADTLVIAISEFAVDSTILSNKDFFNSLAKKVNAPVIIGSSRAVNDYVFTGTGGGEKWEY